MTDGLRLTIFIQVVQQGLVLGPALGSQQPHVMLQAGGRVSEKLPSRKEPRDIG